MANLSCEEIKAFVPAKDYALSCEFYQQMGFELAWQSPEMAYFYQGDCSFLLQNFYNQQHAENFMMHLLVEDVQAWHAQLKSAGLAQKYGITITEPTLQPWHMIDFVVYDPSGVLWRIGQNSEPE
ncbi:VOC family protein [Pseudoalteromonas haloplanktis]|uniref:VOC family protein n=1 Tax=Pseudoalteromonas haloplanktis TaxID=228 RepID=A0ABU1B744_PSEHA|nr:MULTISPECIES: VOC family protein [Pseudoalteromonas]MDQ9090261.1 VOC family protein [Pseudoalteromonas haloplanktis]TMN71724.1 glyoxalase [Pseudoalteromonas sp. S1727]